MNGGWHTDIGSPRGAGSRFTGCGVILLTMIIAVVAAVALLEILA